MSTHTLHDRFDFVRQLALDAGRFAQDYQQRLIDGGLTIIAKGVQDFVSEADRETERFIRQRLAARFPEDGFLGEESGASEQHPAIPSPGTWVVDPIDGTTNFLRGQPLWCVSIAYVVDGTPLLGAISVPIMNELFYAMQGEGAWLNGHPLRVNQGAREAATLVLLGSSRHCAMQDYLAWLERLQREEIEHRRYGSAAIALAYVAAGRFDGYREELIYAWDIFAGVVLLREAGAWVDLKPRQTGYSIRTAIPALKPLFSD